MTDLKEETNKYVCEWSEFPKTGETYLLQGWRGVGGRWRWRKKGKKRKNGDAVSRNRKDSCRELMFYLKIQHWTKFFKVERERENTEDDRFKESKSQLVNTLGLEDITPQIRKWMNTIVSSLSPLCPDEMKDLENSSRFEPCVFGSPPYICASSPYSFPPPPHPDPLHLTTSWSFFSGFLCDETEE